MLDKMVVCKNKQRQNVELLRLPCLERPLGQVPSDECEPAFATPFFDCLALDAATKRK
jgi:hypothetical protein